MPAQLKNGVQGAPGGYRKGAGRKPDKLKKKLRAIAAGQGSLKFLKDAIEGKDVDARVVEGKKTMMPAPAGTRAAIWESVHDRGYGKPASIVEMGKLEGQAMALPAVVLLPDWGQRE